ncbi:MAG: hypothetical protein FWG31_02755 [Oscillospiraceae bacterium]|nr:hypothetical protein [Oscillospiraceae bacterium]
MLTELNSLNLANILLYNPYTTDGMRHDSSLFSFAGMSKDDRLREFYDKGMYTDPFFISDEWEIIANNSEECDDENAKEDRRYKETYISGLRTQYNEFVNSFTGRDVTNYPLSESIYILEGSIGCGKSTFINYLLRQLPNPKLNNFFYDLEEPPRSNIKFMENRHIEKDNTPINTLVLILLECIGNVFKSVNSPDGSLLNGISNIYDEYETQFMSKDEAHFVSFFEKIKEIISVSAKCCDGLPNDIYNLCKNIIISNKPNSDNAKTVETCKINLIETLTGVF